MGEMERLDPWRLVGVEYKPDGEKSLQNQQNADATSKYVCFVPNAIGDWRPSPTPFSVPSLLALSSQLRRRILFPTIQSLCSAAVAVRVCYRLYDSI